MSATRKIAAGVYETPTGHRIEFIPASSHYGPAWFLTLAEEHRVHDFYPTKRDAVEAALAHDERDA